MTVNSNASQRTNTIIGILIVIVIIVTVIGVMVFKNQSSGNNEYRQITYKVDATGGYAQIIYTNSSGVNTEPEILTTPFTKTISFPIGQKVYLTASNPSQTGDVYCKIMIDNQAWKESRGTHPVDSVACGGIIR